MIKRDKRWEVFYGDISLEEFADKKIPKPVFQKEVHQDIRDSFGVVHKLLIHSYYEYLFLDVAVTKALHVLEMSLCIRYKELTNNEWDLKKNPLSKLMDWFYKGVRFEVNDPGILNHVREIRNHLTHPKGHHIAGTVGLPWIYAIIDLINGLYDDVEERKIRWESTKVYGKKLETFLDNGGKLTYLNHVCYIYDVGSLKVENRLKPDLCYFGLLPLFDPKDTIPKLPLVFEYPLNDLTIEGARIEMSLGTGKVCLTNDLNQDELEKISVFRAKLKSDQAHYSQSWMMIFHTQNSISEAIRAKLKDIYQSN